MEWRAFPERLLIGPGWCIPDCQLIHISDGVSQQRCHGYTVIDLPPKIVSPSVSRDCGIPNHFDLMIHDVMVPSADQFLVYG